MARVDALRQEPAGQCNFCRSGLTGGGKTQEVHLICISFSASPRGGRCVWVALLGFCPFERFSVYATSPAYELV